MINSDLGKYELMCELASFTAVNPHLWEMVGMARCGDVWFGANWNGYRTWFVSLWVGVCLLTE